MTANKNKNITTNGISFKMLSMVVIIMSIALILSMIKIYLSNQIYYESKKVNKIQREVQALKAEKIILQQNIELLKFQYKVADTIFNIDEGSE